ncbi:hypothetical protein [Burkholderia sp. LMU1-1-1.1]|uniref:hypothetical protein n=1 Tax=Burkholderia sp. LMU1-1-1.1 TaxID=3135266 RepID=UPI0034174B8A
MNHSNFRVNEYKFDIPNSVIAGAQRAYESYVANTPIPSVTNLTTEIVSTAALTASTATAWDASNARATSVPPALGYPHPAGAFDDHVGYSFTVEDGAVTAVQITTKFGTTALSSTLPIGPTTTFSIGADGTVTENSVYGHTIERTDFKLSSETGLYTKTDVMVSDIPANGAATLLDVAPYARATFTFDANGAISAAQQVLPDGNKLTITPGGGLAYSSLEPGYVLETRSVGGYTFNEVYHDGNGDGIYTAVAHGSGNTVDIVGLKAQITGAIDSVL